MRALRWIPVALATASLVSVLGCGAELPERAPVPVDCSAADAYELSIVRPFEDPEASTWFESADSTGQVRCEDEALAPVDPNAPVGPNAPVDPNAPNDAEPAGPCLEPGPYAATASATIAPVPEGERCGSLYATVLEAQGNNDWGAVFGDHQLAINPRDASAYEGIAVWARSGPLSNKTLTVILDDRYTTAEGGICEENVIEDGARGPELVGQPGVVLPGAVPGENDCGNSYQRLLTVTEQWQLHLLPFSSFSQDPLPNRRFEGPDTTALYGLLFRAPKEARLEIWIDDLGYYRPKP